VARCPSCGAELPAEARFCALCGTPIVSGRVVAEERRTVTILFADLVGFTERSDRADPEDVRRTLVPFHRRVKEDLERYGGTLDKFIGDAVMGVFGAPIAHDDDPTRAVRAALAVLRSVGDLQQYDPGLAVRVAVNTGEALVSFGVGPQIGEAVAGDVVNTASRMQALAERDSVVIGETTLRAVRDRFEVEALPVALVKGKAEPLAVWRVVGERAVTEAERTPFVGRRRELATLVDRFEGVKRLGTAALVTVVAEAGVGKSRLVSELAWRLANRARTLIGACSPYGEGVTFAPIEQSVGALIGAELTDDPATWERRLEELAARVEPDPAERRWLVRTLGAVLALQIGVEGGASEIGPDELAQAWARVLDAAAGERPLLLVIEDLHHAAPALIEVLASTIELLAGRPVLGSRRCDRVREAARPRRWRRRPRSPSGRSTRTTRASSSARCSSTALSRKPPARRSSSARPATHCTRSSSPGWSWSPGASTRPRLPHRFRPSSPPGSTPRPRRFEPSYRTRPCWATRCGPRRWRAWTSARSPTFATAWSTSSAEGSSLPGPRPSRIARRSGSHKGSCARSPTHASRVRREPNGIWPRGGGSRTRPATAPRSGPSRSPVTT
jgi:class 3 adenylate cyclase